jgi:hypothetical protein
LYWPASLDVLDWVRGQLTQEDAQFLLDLRATATLAIDGLGEVCFCHATPRNDIDFFTDVTPEDRLAHVFAEWGRTAFVTPGCGC